MSDANRMYMRFGPEATWGVTDSIAGTLVRITSETLTQETEFQASQELRSDRAVPRGARTNIQAAGDINFEMSYGNLDLLISGLCGASAWPSTTTVTGTDISAAASDNSYNSAGSGFPAFVAGQMIRTSGFTGTAANNGWARVVTATASKIVVEGITLTDDAAGESVTIGGTRLLGNGTTKVSYTSEKGFQDITQFISLTGLRPGTFSLNMEVNSLITGSMGFLGKSAAITQATVFTGSATAAPTNDVMNVVDDFEKIIEGGSELTGVTAFSFTVNNNLRQKPALGQLGGTDIGLGSVNVEGSLTAYFENEVQYEKYLNRTETDIAVAIEDQAGNGYGFSFPAVDFVSGGEVVNRGINSEVVAVLPWQAHYNATYNEMYSISRVAA